MSTQWWTWSDAYTTRRGRPSPARPSSRTFPGVMARRAAASAVKFAIDPPDTRMPSASGGNPTIEAIHRMTSLSTCIAA